MRTLSPCLDCADRAIGCHGKCEKYWAFRAAADAELVDIKGQKAEDRNQREILFKRIERIKKTSHPYKVTR